MIYITGDLHRDFTRVFAFARKKQTTKEDILIVLGDVGINYYLDDSDKISCLLPIYLHFKTEVLEHVSN